MRSVLASVYLAADFNEEARKLLVREAASNFAYPDTMVLTMTLSVWADVAAGSDTWPPPTCFTANSPLGPTKCSTPDRRFSVPSPITSAS